MSNKTYTYGETVIEFEAHSEEDYQKLLNRNTEQYNRWSEGLYHKGMAVHIDYVRYIPLEMALIELQDFIRKGYSIVKAESRSLFFKCILRKPEQTVAAELIILAETTREEYERARFERNETKTAQMLEETIANKRYEAAAEAAEKLAKATARKDAAEAQTALADLMAAYTKPAQPHAQVTA